MLSWSAILKKIRDEMSLPFQQLEISNDQIIEYLKETALPEFTFYFPQKWRMTLNTTDQSVRVPGRNSEFYLLDPDDREIKTVVGVYPTLTRFIYHGHPIKGTMFMDVEEWHLSVYNSNLNSPYSELKFMHEFIPPNQLRITPTYSGKVVVEYERSHDPELSTINPELQHYFRDLCQGLFFMRVGRLRQKYTNMQTPFGEIPLNGDALYQEGKEIYDKTIEKFERLTVPNVVFDYG
jgi:hypothetical protein